MSGLAPPFPWTVVESLNNQPLFDAATATELFLVVGRPADAPWKADAAAFRLSEIAKSFAFDLWRQGQPRSDVELDVAMRVASHLGEALKLTGVGTRAEPLADDVLPSFGPGGLFASARVRGELNGREATMNLLRAVYLLRLDALKMAETRVKRAAIKGAPKPGKPEDRALKKLVAALSDFYFAVWGQVPAVSRSKAKASMGQVSGGFVRLLSEVNRRLQASGLRYYATDESLVSHWRSLPPDQRFRFHIGETQSR